MEHCENRRGDHFEEGLKLKFIKQSVVRKGTECDHGLREEGGGEGLSTEWVHSSN